MLVSGDAGTYAFCKNCELYEKCDHNGQKILRINSLIIDFVYADERKIRKGTIYDQPVWFLELTNYARQIRAKENARKSKSKSNS